MAESQSAARQTLYDLPWTNKSNCPECGSMHTFYVVSTPTVHGRGRHCRDCDYKWVPKMPELRPDD